MTRPVSLFAHVRFSLLALVLALVFASACGGAADSEPSDRANAPNAPNASTPEAPLPAEPAPPGSSSTQPDPCAGAFLVVDVAQWMRAGTNPNGYEMSSDPTRVFCNKPGAHVRSLEKATADKFGTFMGTLSAAPYRGKRVRLRGVMETAAVEGWAGMWLRVDDAMKKVLAFDNMGKRALRGTLEPAPHAVVLDVPTDADVLAFGILLSGKGEVWTKEIVIETVGVEVPTTNL